MHRNGLDFHRWVSPSRSRGVFVVGVGGVVVVGGGGGGGGGGERGKREHRNGPGCSQVGE